jgi:hypothetical protein
MPAGMHYYLSLLRVPVEDVLLCFSRSALIERRATELIALILYLQSFNLRRCVLAVTVAIWTDGRLATPSPVSPMGCTRFDM